jgi:hypothetical protein
MQNVSLPMYSLPAQPATSHTGFSVSTRVTFHGSGAFMYHHIVVFHVEGDINVRSNLKNIP